MKNEERVWQETFVVPECLGNAHLKYKIAKLTEERWEIIDVVLGEIPQLGSSSTPHAANYGKTEPGWRIQAKRKLDRKAITS